MLRIERIAMLKDNYTWLLTCTDSGVTAVVDAAEPQPVLERLRDGRLDMILNTHHHNDHVGANLALKAATGCRIIGPAMDAERIPGIDQGVADGDRVMCGLCPAEVMFVPGHTRGHIAYWFAGENALFCGDTLFSLGCGRLFEGTPVQMWQSLRRIRDLPARTMIHCAHEYTASNARFALAVDGENPRLQAFVAGVTALRQADEPTVPSRLGEEILVNPFLRADDPALAARLGLAGHPAEEVFAELRRRKDVF